MTRQTKRDIAKVINIISGTLTVLILLVGLMISKYENMSPIINDFISLFFSIYAFSLGYLKGWDGNNKSSTLKGP